MAAITTDLPSSVEDSLAACPRFRILLVGNSGVGKSSLVASIFNISLNFNIDIAHDRAGGANITHAYECSDNPRFILHDSQGFEPGQTGNWETAEKFLRDKAAQPLQDRIHAIWLCVETPRTGGRLLQTSDEKLLNLAEELKISVIIVLTKYDMLVNEHECKIMKKQRKNVLTSAEKETAKKNAEKCFMQRVDALPKVPFVRVSDRKEYHYTLQQLTETTRKRLHKVEGELWIPWAIAQRIDARQKVEQSIDEGLKKYWKDLGTSTIFRERSLLSCLARIHKDIIKVWNFNDPHKLLLRESFFTNMIRLSEPLLLVSGNHDNRNDWLSTYSNVTSLVSFLGTTLAQLLGAAGIGIFAIKFLYRTYEKGSRTGRFLTAYIVDLTVVLHYLFADTLSRDPPRQLSKDLISGAMASYTLSDIKLNHNHICNTFSDQNFKANITHLIRNTTGDRDEQR